MQAHMRRNAKRATDVNARRTNEINDIQSKLRQKFIEVSDFVRDCNAKQAVADEKIHKELQAQQEMTAEIEQLSKDIACLNEFKDVLNEKVTEYDPYKTVVEQVLQQCDLYRNKKDLIDRCDALRKYLNTLQKGVESFVFPIFASVLAQVEVAEKEQECIRVVAEMREDMAKTTSDANLIVLGLESALLNIEVSCWICWKIHPPHITVSIIQIHSQKEYGRAKEKCTKWENALEATKDAIVDKEYLTWRLLDQIQQLYKLFTQRNSEDVILKRQEVEEQLDYIKEEIETIQEIIEASKEMMNREAMSDIAQDGSHKSKT